MEAGNRHYNRQTSYISGNTARKLSVVPDQDYEYAQPRREITRVPERRPEQRPQKRPSRRPRVSRGIDFFSMVLLCAAMAVTIYVCYNYLTAQSDAIQLDKKIVALESEANQLKDQNDALEISLNQPVDFDEVYRIAVGELGMVHPNKNEVIQYNNNDTGYTRQYDDIPELQSDSILDKLRQ